MRPPLDGPLVISQLYGGNPISEAYQSQYPWNKGVGIIGHDGVDINAEMGQPVYPVWTGYIEIVDQNWGFGLHVMLTDRLGRRFLYAHLSEVIVPSGSQVAIHIPFAKAGSSGNSTGPHVHGGYYPPGMDIWNGYGGAINWLSSLDHDVTQRIDLHLTNLS